jgi:hypothetical protein
METEIKQLVLERAAVSFCAYSDSPRATTGGHFSYNEAVILKGTLLPPPTFYAHIQVPTHSHSNLSPLLRSKALAAPEHASCLCLMTFCEGVLHSGFWEHELFPALCYLWKLLHLFLFDGATPSSMPPYLG